MVRLVKGAYWDTEIKRAQERGLADYPVFTRKAMTDLCYLDCARKLLAARPRLYPQFATHNALTVASVIEDAGGTRGYEFQRLHGMGDALYAALLAELPDLTCRVYAPVGGYADLLAYLVRRLLENGANSSFVSVAADPERADRNHSAAAAKLDRRSGARAAFAHSDAARSVWRRRGAIRPASNSATAPRLTALLAEVAAAPKIVDAAPLIDGVAVSGTKRAVTSPIDGKAIGAVQEGDAAIVAAAMAAAQAGFAAWNAAGVAARADALNAPAILIEQNRGRLIALLQSEGGKTLDDCVSEVREAADFCRYYAARGAPHAGAATCCRGRPARATNCAIAAVACSSASARGIFRWRFSPARSRRRSPPATRWWPSRPSRRRWSPSRR